MTVGEEVDFLQIAITPSNTIPSDGRVQIKFPKWNSGTQVTSLASSMFKVNEQTDEVDRVELGFFIECSASGHPSLKCSVNQ